MENIQTILSKRVQKAVVGKVNTPWEQAVEFLEYIGLNTDKGNVIFVLGLCKKFGAGKVYNLKSYMKDANYDPSRVKGLLVHLLKERSEAK